MSREALALAQRRMFHLRLTGPRLPDAVSVVRYLTAVQSQDHAPALWSIAQRMDGARALDLEAAFARGDFLRTHVLRPTWHFVLPEDLHVLLAVSAPRIRRFSAYYDRQLQIDGKLLARAEKLVGKALQAGKHLTRAELVAVLARGKIDASLGQRMGHIMMHLELAALVVSGAPRGKQQTYALVDERVPRPRRLAAAEALRETVLSYFTSHGPATLKDLCWWASLGAGDLKPVIAGLVAEKALLSAELAGFTCYVVGEAGPAEKKPRVHLLQAYDEYSVGASESKVVVDSAGLAGTIHAAGREVYNHLLVIDSQLAGRWKRTIGKTLHISTSLYRPLRKAEERALAAESHRQASFLGLAEIDV